MEFFLYAYDYIFYRTYSFFQKKNDDISDEKATNLVVTLQCFFVINIFIIVRLIFDFEINKQYYNKWVWGLPLVILIGIYNHRRYKKKFKKDNYSKFHSLWNDEIEYKKKRNGWLIIAYIIISIIILPVLYVILK
jgi:hypothetical protein